MPQVLPYQVEGVEMNPKFALYELAIYRLREALHAAKIPHYVCDDCFYSCPKTGESCNELPNDVCDCGADAHNAKIDEALSEK